MKRILTTLMCLCLFSNLFGQINNAGCNTRSPWVSSKFRNLQANIYNDTWSIFCPGGVRFNGPNTLLDDNLGDPHRLSFLAGFGCDYVVGVKDKSNVYPAGTYAGYNIGTGGFIPGVSVGTVIYVTTYLKGVEQETKNVALELFNLEWGVDIGDRYDAGFITKKPFDEIKISYFSAISALNEFKIYYPVIEQFCKGPELACNVSTSLSNPTHPVYVKDSGITGISVGSFISNVENVVSESNTDAATIFMPVGILASGYVSVKNALETYPAGHFAGFEFANPSLVGLEVLNYVTISTYLDGKLQETHLANLLLTSAPLVDFGGRKTAGFITSKSFDEVRFTMGQPIGVTLGSTQVYNAVVKKYCEAPELQCNTLTKMIEPTYPVDISTTNTGIFGLACVGCSIQNTDNIIDGDELNFADIIMVAGVAVQASVAVKDGISTYPKGTYAGFDIQNLSLINADVLNAITINTYLDGKIQESRSQSFDIATVGTSVIIDDGRRVIGFVSGKPFDEVQIQFHNLATVNFGSIKVYSAVIKKFCEVELECNTTTYLSEPTSPVVIESTRTGFGGLACVGCSVNSTPNVISPSREDFATITTGVGVVNGGSISVKDGFSKYPAGSTAGFVIQDANTIAQADILQVITISTYLDGALQETSISGVSLVDFAPIIDWVIGSGGRIKHAGFKTTKPFDEIQVNAGSFASVFNSIRVYSAFVDTRGAEGCSLYLVDDIANATEDTPQDINVLENDFNIPTEGTITTTQPTNGAVVINDGGTPNDISDDTVTYTPAPGFVGEDTFSYTVCDNNVPANCDTADVVVTVAEKPVVLVDDVATVEQDTPVNVDILENDANIPADGTLATTQPANGAVVINDGGTPNDISDDTVTYTPTPGFVGEDTFSYTVCDSAGVNCDTADVVVTVTEKPVIVDPANLVDDVATVEQDTPVNVDILENDANIPADGTLATTQPANGAVVINDGGTPNDISDDTVTYTPTPGFVGEDTFSYTVCDSAGVNCDTADVVVTVTEKPVIVDPTVLVDDTATVFESTEAIINVVDNDSNLPTEGTFTVTSPMIGIVSVNDGGTPNNPSDDTVTYIPAPGFIGEETFTYTICDNQNNCNTANVVVNVIKSPMVLVDDVATVDENVLTGINVLENDQFVPTEGTFSVTQGANGTVNYGNGGTINDPSDNNVLYTPNKGFLGTDTFTYTICDNENNCDTANVTVTVVSKSNIPDYSLTILAPKDNKVGVKTTKNFRLLVKELLGKESIAGASPVQIRFIKNTIDYELSFDPTLTAISATEEVSNSSWMVDDSDPTFFILTYTGNNGVYPGGSDQLVGFGITPVRQNSGVVDVLISIKNTSGGEVNSRNNRGTFRYTTN